MPASVFAFVLTLIGLVVVASLGWIFISILRFILKYLGWLDPLLNFVEEGQARNLEFDR